MNKGGMIEKGSEWQKYDSYAENGHHIKLLPVYIFGRQLINYKVC